MLFKIYSSVFGRQYKNSCPSVIRKLWCVMLPDAEGLPVTSGQIFWYIYVCMCLHTCKHLIATLDEWVIFFFGFIHYYNTEERFVSPKLTIPQSINVFLVKRENKSIINRLLKNILVHKFMRSQTALGHIKCTFIFHQLIDCSYFIPIWSIPGGQMPDEQKWVWGSSDKKKLFPRHAIPVCSR